MAKECDCFSQLGVAREYYDDDDNDDDDDDDDDDGDF